MGSMDGQKVDFASVLEAMPQPIAVCDMDGEVLFLNGAARRFLGVEPADELPTFALSRRATFSQVRIRSEGPIREYFLADVEVDGAARAKISMSLSPLGEWGYRAVLEAPPPAVMNSILDELDALVAICDGRRRIRLANAPLSDLLADLEGGHQGQDLLELFDPEDRPALRVGASQALAGGEPEEFEARLALPGVAAGGGQIRVRIRPLEQDDIAGGETPRRGVLMIAHPTEASFAELQKRFARAEELMSLGQLATGVAHELKNPLTSILNYAEYLLAKYRGQFIEESDGTRLQRIVEGVERIDGFINDLLHLAGADHCDRGPVDVHEMMAAAAKLCRDNLVVNQVEMHWDLASENLTIYGHRGGLKQVFGNLLNNAARAMPDEGGAVTLRSTLDDDWICIEVADSARGMDESLQERIFEPFFSRAHDGSGSGLGLTLVKRIVEDHGGTIAVDSTPGEGTCFTLRFPRYEMKNPG